MTIPDDPFDEKFWSLPKHPSNLVSQDDFDDIHRAMGRTMDVWESVQDSLSLLYVSVCGLRATSLQINSARAFGTIESLKGKWDAITFAAEVFFSDHWNDLDIRGKFENIGKCLQKASYKRNDIAHGHANRYVTFVDGGTLPDGTPIRKMKEWGVFLSPPSYRSSKNDLMSKFSTDPEVLEPGKSYTYTSNEILIFSGKFEALAKELYSLANKCQTVSTFTHTPVPTPPLVEQIIAQRKVEDEKEKIAREQRRSGHIRRQQERAQESRRKPPLSRPRPHAQSDERLPDNQSADQNDPTD